jgi:hypothetical protein
VPLTVILGSTTSVSHNVQNSWTKSYEEEKKPIKASQKICKTSNFDVNN